MFEYELQKDFYKVILENNNREVKIGKQWVDKTATALGLSEFETIEMWLEDNDYLENEALESLDAKAKENKVKLNAETRSKERKPRTTAPKSNPEKENIIKNIAEMLKNMAENVEITNKSKLIEFKIGENEYKIDLICKRKQKKWKNFVFFCKKVLTKGAEMWYNFSARAQACGTAPKKRTPYGDFLREKVALADFFPFSRKWSKRSGPTEQIGQRGFSREKVDLKAKF